MPVKPHHRFVLTELLCQIDSLGETIARFDAQIQAICGPFEEAVGLLDTITSHGAIAGSSAA
jgi:transposase